ncbi:sensor histidine kinase [Pontibacter vulgaris]|uniref:sensor histidine kinase n=1 Tax=Pontibacter vulgaris TaxID=2905679 RepID=UPI001FA78187|nr:ATP-binding protein [Pontibacter vulgaris]
MKKSLNFIQQSINILPDATIVIDQQGHIVTANHNTTLLFEYELEELAGRELAMLIPQQYRVAHSEHIKKYMEQPSVRKMGEGMHLYGQKKFGEEIDVDVALAPITLRDVPLVIATIRDITDKKELERRLLKKNEQLEIINAELERFSYIISHDLKAPLINIHALVHLMTRELPKEKGAKLDRYIQALRSSLEAMSGLISGVAAYSKAGISECEDDVVDLNETLDEVFKLVHLPSRFHLDTQGQLPVIRGNRTKILQVFLNLITNSVKYNDKEAPVLAIHSKETSRYHCITVEDNGPGVPVELRKKIFHLFRKGSIDHIDSQGIGLAVVKKIIENRGGSINVDDSPLGGAAFSFKWPKYNSEKKRTQNPDGIKYKQGATDGSTIMQVGTNTIELNPE